MSSYIIGVDIGGTKISVVLGDDKGKVYDRMMFHPHLGDEAKESLRELRDVITVILHKNKVKVKSVAGIGLGVPGPTDAKRGIVGASPNLPGWEGMSLKSYVQRQFKRPVFWDNDANAAALGEKIFGAGRKFEHFVYITVSTGIGSGIVCNGEILRGTNNTAGELGHMTIFPGGNKCNCGKRGCLEAYASGTAIALQAKAMIKRGRRSNLLDKVRDPSKITCEIVAKCAHEGDRLSVELYQNAGHFFGIGVANVINLLNPQRIFVGGSVIKGPDHFWKAMLKAVEREAWPEPLKVCRIEHSKLGERIGDLGTVALVVDSLRTKR